MPSYEMSHLKGPLYLMPFTLKSVLLFHLLQQSGSQSAGFLDNDGALHQKTYKGCLIVSPGQINDTTAPFTVILCEAKHDDVLQKQLETVPHAQVIKASDLSAGPAPTGGVAAIDIAAFCALAPKQSVNIPARLHTYETYPTWELLALYWEERVRQPYHFCQKTALGASPAPNANAVVCLNATKPTPAAWLAECLESLRQQSFAGYSLCVLLPLAGGPAVQAMVQAALPQKQAIYHTLAQPLSNHQLLTEHPALFAAANADAYLFMLNAQDTLAPGALFRCLAALQRHPAARVATAEEDRLYENEFISPYRKEQYRRRQGLDAKTLLRQFIILCPDGLAHLASVAAADLYIINEVLYHYRVTTSSDNNHIKPIAFYLPQFHTFPENDEWWGEGFTEWTNVKKARPFYNGHYQPRVPGTLGYYDLVEDAHIFQRQIDLAREYGIHGFCFYYYWFNGKRLLQRPLDRFLNNKSLDFPFCICWANENWSRRWDGSNDEILMEQPHTTQGYQRFIHDVIPLLQDARYIKIAGAPLLLIYMKSLMPEPEKVFAYWREACAHSGIPQLHISCMEARGQIAPPLQGCDSSVEFPPHTYPALSINEQIPGLDPSFSGNICDYAGYAAPCMNATVRPTLYFRGIMAGWDNTPRKKAAGVVFDGASPAIYKKWLVSLADSTSHLPADQRYLFINAWNEWGEGTYLEPDERYGLAYLQATRQALSINCRPGEEISER